jgi:hypothetical protein
MSTEMTTEHSRRAIPWASIGISAAVAIIASMIVNLIVRAILTSVVDVPDSFEPLDTFFPVIQASVMYGLVATVAFILTWRFASDIRRTWLIVGVAGLVVSFAPPLLLLTGDDASGAGVAILIVMHFVAAAIFIPAFLRLTPE